MKYLKMFENFNNNLNEYIAYHSTNHIIKEFNFDDIDIGAGSSTRIDGMFFSNIPQKSWGEYTYKVKIISENPAIFDLRKSRLDSLGVQELFDAFLKGETSYMLNDLVDYGDMETEEAELLIDKWEYLDLIIVTNENYAKHDIEYIVPSPDYNGKSAKIINLGLI
jgi:hypothetical protein